MALRQRFMWAAIAALAMIGSMSIVRAQQSSAARQTPRPGAPGPTTPGERTSTPPETPQRPANPPQSATLQTGSASTAPNPFISTYKSFPSRTTLIRNATILTASRPAIERGSILLLDGKIAAVGPAVTAPADALIIDAAGKWVTPGVIDTHSHLGVYAAPGIESLSDGNESTSPNTAEVSAEHSLWPQDPQFGLALAGGVTTMQILPGSANLFGGRGVTVKNVPSRYPIGDSRLSGSGIRDPGSAVRDSSAFAHLIRRVRFGATDFARECKKV